MENEFISKNAEDTREFGSLLAKTLEKGKVICLSGELGAGKTTFTQGFLGGLGVEGPYTSPTFVVMKEYQKEFPISNFQFPNKSQILNSKIKKIYHIDAYRVNAEDILSLGFEEIVSNSENVVIIEWADRVKDIIPSDAMQISFEWMDEEKRKIILKSHF